MTKLPMAIIGVLAAAGCAAALVLARQHQTIAQWRQQLQEIAPLREENQRLSALAKSMQEELELARRGQDELVRLRGEVAALRKTKGELVKLEGRLAAANPSLANSALPSDQALLAKSPEIAMIPAASWGNAGLATPEAAFQTVSWAIANRDTNALARGLMWDSMARAKAEALFNAMPESLRQQYGSVDAVVHEWWLNQGTGVAAFRVLSQFDQGPDNAALIEQQQFQDGHVQENSVLFRQDPSGWRQVLTEGMMGRFEGYLNNMAGAPAAGAK